MTFQQYLSKRRITDTPNGDFAADVRRDRKFPDAVRSWSELKAYLRRQAACPEAIVAARAVWRAYARSGA